MHLFKKISNCLFFGLILKKVYTFVRRHQKVEKNSEKKKKNNLKIKSEYNKIFLYFFMIVSKATCSLADVQRI